MSRRLAALAVSLAVVAPEAGAQERVPAISVGAFTSARTCKTYELMWGREAFAAASSSAAAIGYGGAAYASSAAVAFTRSWGTQLVRDCVNNFSRLRESMRAALAASGKFAVAGSGGMVLTGRVSAGDVDRVRIERADMSDGRDDVVVTVEFSLKDRGGRTVFGNILTKRVTLAASLSTEFGSFEQSSGEGGAYTQLQREVAMAVARAVSFHFVPLRVVDATDRRVRLNYGAPFLALGSTIIVPAEGGMRTIKCEVVSTANGSALAEVDGSGRLDDVAIGALAQFVEADDAMANSRRYDRVDLP